MTWKKQKFSPFLLLVYLTRRGWKEENINCEGEKTQRERKEEKWKKIDDVIQIKLKYHYEQAEKWRKMMSGRWRGEGDDAEYNIVSIP